MKKITITLLILFSVSAAFAQDTTRLSLLFLGDVMQHETQINAAYDPVLKKYNYDPCFQFVRPYVQSADLAIGNLELTLNGPPYTGYPQFSAPDGILTGLVNMGVDVLVTANNHCVDKGRKGLERTIHMLDSFNIPHTGTFVDKVARLNEYPLLVKKNGFNLALLNYTYGTNGLPVTSPNIVNVIDTALIAKDLRKAQLMKPDAIIVFLHWGSEYQSLPSAWQKMVGEYCFKKGAQLVIGAHPHVLQPMEWRKEKNQLIVYSLGNFVSGQRKRYTDGGGMIRVGLEKVQFGDSTTLTGIDTAAYILEWVYRTTDAGKDYYVLPVPSFEKNPATFIKSVTGREAFKTFVTDSRSLFSQHNIAVAEDTSVPPDSIVTYRVHFFTLKNTGDKGWTVLPPIPVEFQTEQDAEGNMLYFTGTFSQKKEAEKCRDKIAKDPRYTEATIVEFINDRRRN